MKRSVFNLTRMKRAVALTLMLIMGVSAFKASAQPLTLPNGWKVNGWLAGDDHGCYKIHLVLTDENGNYITSGDVWLPVDCNKTLPSKSHIYRRRCKEGFGFSKC